MAPSDNGMMLVLVMLIVPQFTLVHPYLHLLIVAPLLVYTGCHRAKLEIAKGDAAQARERAARPPDDARTR